MSPFLLNGQPTFVASFADGTSQTILFAEKYGVSSIPADATATGQAYVGGCHWAYFQGDCNAALFGYYYARSGRSDPASVGPGSAADPRDSRFQVQPRADRCHPCLLSTPHPAMNACMADGSVRVIDGGVDRLV
jgi:hypothetical protein